MLEAEKMVLTVEVVLLMVLLNLLAVKVAKVKGPLGPNELQKLPMSMLGGDEE